MEASLTWQGYEHRQRSESIDKGQRAWTKVKEHLIRDLFADDCASFAHSEAALQWLMDHFAKAATDFRLAISVVKMKVMQCITVPDDATAIQPPLITVGDLTLKVVKQCKYLGGVILEDGQIDDDITNCIARASQSFGRLNECIWNSHKISFKAKISLSNAIV